MNQIFLLPQPLRRQIRLSYFFEGRVRQDDPLSYNIEDELQERIDRLRAIIGMGTNNPVVLHERLVQRYQHYLHEAEAIMVTRNLAPA